MRMPIRKKEFFKEQDHTTAKQASRGVESVAPAHSIQDVLNGPLKLAVVDCRVPAQTFLDPQAFGLPDNRPDLWAGLQSAGKQVLARKG